MRWLSNPPVFGDMIRVRCGEIYHFGIFVSENEVIEFGAPPTARAGLSDRDVRVISAPLSEFCDGGEIEVAHFSPAEASQHPSAEEAVAAARGRIGEGGYNLIYNNCEHFANECVTGKRSSTQGDPLRAYFRTLPVLQVFIAKIPEDAPMKPVAHQVRQSEIEACTNTRVAREKYFVWRLLEYGLFRALGKRIDDMDLRRSENGKWLTDGVEISLSHTDGTVAVAVSRAPVGIDIEYTEAVAAERHAKRILTPEELSRYEAAPDGERSAVFLEYWCKKESIFKQDGGRCLRPEEIDTYSHPVLCREISVGGRRLLLAVCSDCLDKLKIFTEIDLSSL